MFKHCCTALFIALGIFNAAYADETSPFDATIPVVNVDDFYNPETKDKFVEDVSRALHEVGFFAAINPEIDTEILQDAYRASEAYFTSPIELKNEIWRPELNGQRGYVHSEIAQGQKAKDFKEFLHIGKDKNIWPSWMDLESPMERLIAQLDRASIPLQKAFALAIGEDENFFINMTQEGECLLRALHYPKNPAEGTVWAAKHTDIDLFTILPMSTEEGLQVFHNGKWIDVRVPPNAIIINCGDKLQNMTNGYFKSSLHQVMAKPDCERYSIVYFVHPKDGDAVDPTARSIAMTGGVQRFPQATSLELLASRLRELGLASPELLEFEKQSGILERTQTLVDAGVAADPVQLTYSLWMKSQGQ